VDIRLDPLPEGAQLFRLWVSDHVYGDAIDTVGVVIPKGDGVCEIQATHGVLPPDGLVLLGMKLYEKGFRVVDFQTIKGTRGRCEKSAATCRHYIPPCGYCEVVMQLKDFETIEAARAYDTAQPRMISRHIMNAMLAQAGLYIPLKRMQDDDTNPFQNAMAAFFDPGISDYNFQSGHPVGSQNVATLLKTQRCMLF